MTIHKADELVQEVNRMRTKSTNVETQLTGVEIDFRTCRDALERITTEKDQLQRQVSGQLVDIDRLRQVSVDPTVIIFILDYIFPIHEII